MRKKLIARENQFPIMFARASYDELKRGSIGGIDNTVKYNFEEINFERENFDNDFERQALYLNSIDYLRLG